MIDRGARAQQSFPNGDGYFVRTTDSARSNPRYGDFQATASAWNRPDALRMAYLDNSTGAGPDYIENASGILFYLTGLSVVPQIATVFTSSKRALPALTVAMLAISDFVRSWGWAMLGGLVAGAFVLRQSLKAPAFRQRFDAGMLGVPSVGLPAAIASSAGGIR